MNKNDLIAIEQYSQEKLGQDTSGHDFYHAKRVVKNAVELAKDEPQVNLTLIQAASYLHDVIDDKVVANPALAEKDLKEFLKSLLWSDSDCDALFRIITSISFSKEMAAGKGSLSLEGKLVQDADRLDALGAIGIFRTAYYGGHSQSPLYDPKQQPKAFTTKTEYRKKSPVLNHFYEKLFLLPDLMNTEAGQLEAKRRVAFMRHFLDEFYSETGEKRPEKE